MLLVELTRLRDKLESQRLAADADTIVAFSIPGKERYHLGKTHCGELCLLIRIDHGRGGVDVRLKNLEVRQGVHCHVITSGGREEFIDGSIVVCRAAQASLVALFLRLIADAMDELGPASTSSAVSCWLQRLSYLLNRLEQDGRKRLQGLWAELLVMQELGEPMLLLRRWHSDPKERFDFVASTFALEVKSCNDYDRVHEFSLEQLRPPSGLDVWVASVVVRPDPAGTSVLELLASIESQLAEASARSLIREIVLATGGSALDDDEHHRFDIASARASLRIIDVKAIPTPFGPIPPEVVSVSVRVRCRDVLKAGHNKLALHRLRGQEI